MSAIEPRNPRHDAAVQVRRKARLVSWLTVPIFIAAIGIWLLFIMIVCSGGRTLPWELVLCAYAQGLPDLAVALVILALGWFVYVLSAFGSVALEEPWAGKSPRRHARHVWQGYARLENRHRRVAWLALEMSGWALLLSLCILGFFHLRYTYPLGILTLAGLARFTYAVLRLLLPRPPRRLFEEESWRPPSAKFPEEAAQWKGKNIVICADGTGNTAIKGRGTNVFKLYEAVDETTIRTLTAMTPASSLSPPQAALYHDGVGTESLKWVRLISGATGWGLSRNVKQLYAELARVYAPGDKIFLFGFSRGAFTVRTLAGLIYACGIPDLTKAASNAEFTTLVNRAYKAYRQAYNSWLTRLFFCTRKLDASRLAELRGEFSVKIPELEPGADGKLIAFIGVWDTVDAVGLPIKGADFVNRVIYNFKFTDRILNPAVARACHALALDEERESFAPLLWDESKEPPGAPRIEQVWFAGVHSNVGGGYPRQGMSLVTLDWMMSQAEAQGLRFLEPERGSYRDHADVNDKMYDSRGGLGIFYRWKPRDVAVLCAESRITPRLHRTVFERIARNTEGYAPGSVPPDVEVASLSRPDVAAEVRRLVRAHHGDGPSVLEREDELQRAGIWAYWLFVWGVFVTAGVAVADSVGLVWARSTTWIELGRQLVAMVVGTDLFVSAARVLWHHPLLAAWLVITLYLALRVDAHLDRAYSEFWQANHLRLVLRKALGLG